MLPTGKRSQTKREESTERMLMDRSLQGSKNGLLLCRGVGAPGDRLVLHHARYLSTSESELLYCQDRSRS